jgi:hypothetical protein
MAIMQADRKHKEFISRYRASHPRSRPLANNYNILLHAVPVVRRHGNCISVSGYRERLIVTSNNEIFYWAKVSKWLPKDSTAAMLEAQNSVFYHTFPAMKRSAAVSKYREYLKVEFYRKNQKIN